MDWHAGMPCWTWQPPCLRVTLPPCLQHAWRGIACSWKAGFAGRTPFPVCQPSLSPSLPDYSLLLALAFCLSVGCWHLISQFVGNQWVVGLHFCFCMLLAGCIFVACRTGRADGPGVGVFASFCQAGAQRGNSGWTVDAALRAFTAFLYGGVPL